MEKIKQVDLVNKDIQKQAELEIIDEQVVKLDMKEFIGKDVGEVKKVVEKKYANLYTFPGSDEYDYLLKNPEKTPESLKDGNRYYFMKLMGKGQGTDLILCLRFDGSKLITDTGYINENKWQNDDRVLLLKKE